MYQIKNGRNLFLFLNQLSTESWVIELIPLKIFTMYNVVFFL